MGTLNMPANLALDDMGILIARPDGDATVGDLGNDDVGFECDVIDRRRIVGVFENLLGFAKTLIEIALTLLEEMYDVRSLQRTRSDIGAAGNDSTRPGVEQWRARLQGFFGVEHRRQLLVFDVDQLQRLCCGIGVQRGHGRHRFADKTDSIQCHRRLVLKNETEVGIDVVADQIIARQHRDYAG